MSDTNNNTWARACPAGTWRGVLCGRLWRLAGIALLAALVAARAVYAEPVPQAVLQEMSDRVLETIRQDPAILDDPVRLRALADELVVPNVDFLALSQWVLGKHWRKATPEQRQVFSDEFRELLIRTYLGSVTRAGYQDQTIRYLPLHNTGDSRTVTVQAQIEQPQGPLLHVQFRLLHRDDVWRVYDVVIEGISLVATHRSSFSNMIREQGLDGLIATLEQRNSDATEAVVAEVASPGEAVAGEAVAGEAVAGEAVAGEAVADEAVAGEAVAGEAEAGEAAPAEAATEDYIPALEW